MTAGVPSASASTRRSITANPLDLGLPRLLLAGACRLQAVPLGGELHHKGSEQVRVH
jgi:hypothetical protein